jgi:hypothetical protein
LLLLPLLLWLLRFLLLLTGPLARVMVSTACSAGPT